MFGAYYFGQPYFAQGPDLTVIVISGQRHIINIKAAIRERVELKAAIRPIVDVKVKI